MRARLSTLLPIGELCATKQALRSLASDSIVSALERHTHCDWGDVCDEDWQRNNDAIRNGNRILSVYCDPTVGEFWVLTEADRSYTTMMLPSEY